MVHDKKVRGMQYGPPPPAVGRHRYQEQMMVNGKQVKGKLDKQHKQILDDHGHWLVNDKKVKETLDIQHKQTLDWLGLDRRAPPWRS
jgi:hypothetical protein